MQGQTMIGKVGPFFIMLTLFALALFSIGCSPKPIQRPSLVGTWQATYNVDNFGTRVIGTEKIQITQDGKYRQEFADPDGYAYQSGWHNWRIIQLPNGKYQLHLENVYCPE
jgi:hypothetical protein